MQCMPHHELTHKHMISLCERTQEQAMHRVNGDETRWFEIRQSQQLSPFVAMLVGLLLLLFERLARAVRFAHSDHMLEDVPAYTVVHGHVQVQHSQRT